MYTYIYINTVTLYLYVTKYWMKRRKKIDIIILTKVYCCYYQCYSYQSG